MRTAQHTASRVSVQPKLTTSRDDAHTSSSLIEGSTMMMPCRWKLNITLPASAIFPPPFCTAVRTSAAVLPAAIGPTQLG